MKSELRKTLKHLPFRQFLLSVSQACPSGTHSKQLMKFYHTKVFLELEGMSPCVQVQGRLVVFLSDVGKLMTEE